MNSGKAIIRKIAKPTFQKLMQSLEYVGNSGTSKCSSQVRESLTHFCPYIYSLLPITIFCKRDKQTKIANSNNNFSFVLSNNYCSVIESNLFKLTIYLLRRRPSRGMSTLKKFN